MNIIETKLHGIFEIQNKKFEDDRGGFVKVFHQTKFLERGLDVDFKESFFSISNRDVLRGMHFQLSPYDHAKLVYVTSGKILDVTVDIRKKSKTFGKFFSIELSAENSKSLYIEKGFAHGFLALTESSTVIYMTNSEHNPNHDTGIKWDSFGFDWPVLNPVLSERDSCFDSIENL